MYLYLLSVTDDAQGMDECFPHVGRPVTLIRHFYRLLFLAWEAHGWGTNTGTGFVFSSCDDVRFQTRMRRTITMVDIDRTSESSGLDGLSLVLRLPGVELTVFHLLENPLEQALTLENGCVLQEAVIQVAKDFRTRVVPEDRERLAKLWDGRGVQTLLWKSREIRLWYWSNDCREALVAICVSMIGWLCRGAPSPCTSTG